MNSKIHFFMLSNIVKVDHLRCLSLELHMDLSCRALPSFSHFCRMSHDIEIKLKSKLIAQLTQNITHVQHFIFISSNPFNFMCVSDMVTAAVDRCCFELWRQKKTWITRMSQCHDKVVSCEHHQFYFDRILNHLLLCHPKSEQKRKNFYLSNRIKMIICYSILCSETIMRRRSFESHHRKGFIRARVWVPKKVNFLAVKIMNQVRKMFHFSFNVRSFEL